MKDDEFLREIVSFGTERETEWVGVHEDVTKEPGFRHRQLITFEGKYLYFYPQERLRLKRYAMLIVQNVFSFKSGTTSYARLCAINYPHPCNENQNNGEFWSYLHKAVTRSLILQKETRANWSNLRQQKAAFKKSQ